jgi:hypothetical protein
MKKLGRMQFRTRTMLLVILAFGVVIAIGRRIPTGIRRFQEQATLEAEARDSLQLLQAELPIIRRKLEEAQSAPSPDRREIAWGKDYEQWYLRWIEHMRITIRFHSDMKWRYILSALLVQRAPDDTPPFFDGPFLYSHPPNAVRTFRVKPAAHRLGKN